MECNISECMFFRRSPWVNFFIFNIKVSPLYWCPLCSSTRAYRESSRVQELWTGFILSYYLLSMTFSLLPFFMNKISNMQPLLHLLSHFMVQDFIRGNSHSLMRFTVYIYLITSLFCMFGGVGPTWPFSARAWVLPTDVLTFYLNFLLTFIIFI